MNDTIRVCLDHVRKPARYTGGEYNAVCKDKAEVDLRFAFCFPDLYEIGMSHLGSKILYGLMNGMEGVWCERAYAPYVDMEEEMRRRGPFMRWRAAIPSRNLISWALRCSMR